MATSGGVAVGILFGRAIDLLCLDMDDTLIDTEAATPRRFEDATRTIRRIRPDIPAAAIATAVARSLAVDPTRGRLANFLAELGISAAADAAAVREGYFESMPEGTRLFEGAHDILGALRERFRLAIVTNGPSDLQRRKLAYFDLERRVDWVVVSGEAGVDKPDPAIFEHVLQLAGVQARRAAHAGDSLLSDIAGANRSGLLSIQVETRFPRDGDGEGDLKPDETVGHVRELLEASSGSTENKRT